MWKGEKIHLDNIMIVYTKLKMVHISVSLLTYCEKTYFGSDVNSMHYDHHNFFKDFCSVVYNACILRETITPQALIFVMRSTGWFDVL